MALRAGFSNGVIAANIAKLRREKFTAAQAAKIALDRAREFYRARHPTGKLPAHLGARQGNPSSVFPLDMVGSLAGLKLFNPGKLSTARELAAARQLFQKFTGLPANDLLKIDKPKLPDVALAVGYVDAIEYTTQRNTGNKAEVIPYRHKFASSARPLLAVSHDGKMLLIIGGKFRFTHLGITDHA